MNRLRLWGWRCKAWWYRRPFAYSTLGRWQFAWIVQRTGTTMTIDRAWRDLGSGEPFTIVEPV